MTSHQGKLILAAPSLLDPNFMQTVVYLVQHDDDGAMGLVINRPLKATLRQAWEQIETHIHCDIDDNLFHGGPCSGPLMVLHTHTSVAQIELPDGVCFSTEKSAVEWIVENNEDAAAKFCIGYSGWSAEQLEAELEEGSWVVAHASPDRIFSNSTALWERVMRLTHPNVFLNPQAKPGDPSWN